VRCGAGTGVVEGMEIERRERRRRERKGKGNGEVEGGDTSN